FWTILLRVQSAGGWPILSPLLLRVGSLIASFIPLRFKRSCCSPCLRVSVVKIPASPRLHGGSLIGDLRQLHQSRRCPHGRITPAPLIPSPFSAFSASFT